MLIVEARNVNDAFEKVVRFFTRKKNGKGIRRETSRNGDVFRAEGPASVAYERPRERVLFSAARDANPFFHLYEALWMLGGRNDLKSLSYYVSNFGNYSDDGETLNGAYGYRWRNARIADVYNADDEPLQDQLSLLVNHLQKNPASRRAVLQMWNAEDDLLRVDDSKDVCCNLSVVFEIEETGVCKRNHRDDSDTDECAKKGHQTRVLNMTVFNRSNDAIWGALGANAVHFSFLQEYLAAHLRVGVGVYYQISSNFHVYSDNFNLDRKFWEREFRNAQEPNYDLWSPSELVPLVLDVDRFDRELIAFLDNNEAAVQEPFLKDVAQPMATAYRHHKERDYGRAQEAIRLVRSSDWRWAAHSWMDRRERKWQRSRTK